MTSRMRAVLAAGAIVMAGGIACGGSSGGGPGRSGLKTVLLDAVEFQPLNVSISVGDTVVWSWKNGSTDHNIISTGASTFPSEGTTTTPGVKGTDIFDAPHSYQYIFGAAGTYAYYCSTHGTPATGMHGSVVVSP